VSTVFRKNVTPVPLYMQRADGPYFHDVEGQKLLDYGLAWGPLIVGNNHPRLNAAIMEQLTKAYTYGYQHQGEIDLAERMCKAIPGVERVIYSNTGTEAVQAALRIARGYTGRDKIIKFEGHYHGWLNNMLVSVHPTEEQLGKTSPTCGGQPADEYSLIITLPWNDLDALKKAFVDNPGEIAAVISEPILVNSGSCMPQEGFLEGMIDLCRENGSVSIFDEVITGFRIALGGAREYFNLTPDMTPDLSVYAKAMAGGFSMSAVGGSAKVLGALEEGRTTHAGTYNGNPICTAAAIATIDILSEPGTYDRMHAHGYAIREAIEKAAKDNGQQLVTSGLGSEFSVHFGLTEAPKRWTDVMKSDGDTYTRFRSAMRERHILNLPEGRWYIGAVHTDKELDIVIPAIQESMKEIA
jgi:glutamate-1-semialdehyde 2,1-aminomutase